MISPWTCKTGRRCVNRMATREEMSNSRMWLRHPRLRRRRCSNGALGRRVGTTCLAFVNGWAFYWNRPIIPSTRQEWNKKKLRTLSVRFKGLIRICVGLIGLSIFFHLGFTKCGWFEGVVCALGSLYISTKRKKEKKRKKK